MTIEHFDSLPDVVKRIILHNAEEKEAEKKTFSEVLDSMYKHGEGYVVLAIVEDVAIIKQDVNPSFPEAPFTFSLYEIDKWRASSFFFPSIDAALLGAIGYKHDGANSQFSIFARRMLNIE